MSLCYNFPIIISNNNKKRGGMMAYYNPTLTQEDLISDLLGLDEELFVYAMKEGLLDLPAIRIVIAGSSALILNQIHIDRTMDIDILRISSYITDALLAKYHMNTRVQCTEDSLPYNWEDRIVPLNLKTSIISYYTLSIEDAICAKIAAGRAKDEDHLQADNLKRFINWEQLKRCAEEMALSSLNERRFLEFKHRYNTYVEENHHEEAKLENL